MSLNHFYGLKMTMNLVPVMFFVPLLLLAFVSVPPGDFLSSGYVVEAAAVSPLDGLQVQMVTERGNVFTIDADELSAMIDGNSPDDQNDTKSDAESMIDGMGILSKIIQVDHSEGAITHGNGTVGEYESLRPYIPVSSGSNFAATILNTDTQQSYYFQDFWHTYNFTGSSLRDITSASANILGYSQTRDLHGSSSVSLSDAGITISGTGKTLLKLNGVQNNTLKIIGNVSSGSHLKVLEAETNLITTTYDAVKGFLLSHCNCDPASSSFNVLTSDNGNTEITGRFDYDQDYSVVYYFGKCCKGQYTKIWGGSASVTPNLIFTSDPEGGYRLKGDTTDMVLATVTHPGNFLRLDYNTVSNPEHWVYDKNGGPLTKHWTSDFKTITEFDPVRDTYLVAEPNGNTIFVKGVQFDPGTEAFLRINELPPNIPYQITLNGQPVAAGMTSMSGQITAATEAISQSDVGGFLKLYPDSLAYRGSFNTVVFDSLNNETIHINTVEDKTYVVHAYAKIPVVGTVNATDVNLDGTLDLPYLNKQYVGGNILVPVIPGHDTINLTLDGLYASINYADILGGTGIKIAEPSTSTVTSNSPDASIPSAEAITGTVAYAIASSDGTMNAIMTETISGTASIANTYVLSKDPPPPPPPVRKDPLSGWVDIFVNGQYVKQISLGSDPNPGFTLTGTASGNTVTRSVAYTYGDYTLSGNASVDVNAGDFVEFYVYAKIHGDIESYTPPDGFSIDSESGVSSATANIRSAHIQTAM